MDITLVASMLLVFAASGASVPDGHTYEVRTVVAMGLRNLVWLASSWAVWHWISLSGCLHHV